MPVFDAPNERSCCETTTRQQKNWKNLKKKIEKKNRLKTALTLQREVVLQRLTHIWKPFMGDFQSWKPFGTTTSGLIAITIQSFKIRIWFIKHILSYSSSKLKDFNPVFILKTIYFIFELLIVFLETSF